MLDHKKYKYLNQRFYNYNKLMPKSNWKNFLYILYKRKKFKTNDYIWHNKLSDRNIRRFIKINRAINKRK